MEECLFVHPDNLSASREKLDIKVAVIARPDWFMQKGGTTHLIVETELGIHTRCYLGQHEGTRFLIIYGRFDRIRSTSRDINYSLTQDVISALQIPVVIGTFAVGSILTEDSAGTVYIPHDLVGFGNFNCTRNAIGGFRNVDMFHPFCLEVRESLVRSARGMTFPVELDGTYVCFHGYPRIETEAELDMYREMGWQIVGQTIDPEATLAREAGCHYAAIAATIDDRELRSRFLANDLSARETINANIQTARMRTFEIFLACIPRLTSLQATRCSCVEQSKHVKKRSSFYYRPDYLCE
jgi:5'-methylthioadenosine phosphorylase